MPTFSVLLSNYSREIFIGLVIVGTIAIFGFFSLSAKDKKALRKLYMKKR